MTALLHRCIKWNSIKLTILTLFLPALAFADKPIATHQMTVYKSPTCGCCAEWVEHLEKAGFHPLVKHPDNLNAVKQQLAIAFEYQSCHTAVHHDFIFEGHIPVKFIQQFLNNPPKRAKGLSVPVMPLGSPGMEMGNRFTPYTIYQLNADGKHTIFVRVAHFEDQY